jgi:signal transduction histidine kinase
LNHPLEADAAGWGGAAANPLIFECDRQGSVRWMSREARAVFGEIGNVADAFRAVAPSGIRAFLSLRSAARFTPILQHGDSIWISAELADRARVAIGQEGALARVYADFLRHYFRLQAVERELSRRAREQRRGNGARTVVQIERERQRLARELHTGIGGTLAAIRLQLEIMTSQLREPPEGVRQAMERIGTLAAEALAYVRSVSKRLHPPEWQRLPLEAALRELWDMSGVPQAFEADLLIDALPQEPALAVKALLYRAAQEAISNLTRHSKATRVRMHLAAAGDRVILTCEDNGIGFDAGRLFSAPARLSAGIGLLSIRDEAAALGGQFSVESGPNGTKLEISAPITGE